jgi:hypothetical protein
MSRRAVVTALPRGWRPEDLGIVVDTAAFGRGRLHGENQMRLTLLAGAAVCAVGALTGCAASGKTAAKDVTIAACTASPTGGHPTASGQILNHSSKASAYTIHVKFKDASGNGEGDGVAVVAKVDAGSSANWHADGSLSAKGPLTCSLSSVTRNLSP